MTIGTDTTSIVNAEEALEIPPIVPLELETPLVTDNDSTLRVGLIESCKLTTLEENEKRNDRRRIFEKIAEQEFEDVVFTPERRNRKSSNKTVNGFADNDSTNFHPKFKLNNGVTTHSSLLTLSIDNDMLLKSDRNLDSIQKDVENKEKLLADVLNFDLSEYMTSSRIYPSDTNILTSIDAIPYDNCSINENEYNSEIKDDIDEEQDEVTDLTETESVEEDASYKTELKKLEDLGECSKILLKNKLSEFQNNNVDIGVEPPTSNINVDSEHQFNGK